MRHWPGWRGLVMVAALTALPVPGAENFSRMSATVQVIAYKRTRTDQILPMSFGSGSLITSRGMVLTNYHVVVNPDDQTPYEAFEIAITFDPHRRPVRRFTARLAAFDRSLDLALLRLNPKDVADKELPALKCVDWQARVSPTQGQAIQVRGYPASGGETLTVTRGQISGFERLNEHPCFKTDTDIDHGSSGGTVLDSKGHFIGIPSFLRSFAENMGYILDIRAARPWIAAHLEDAPAADPVAEARLVTELAAFVRANDERVYRTDLYPRLELTLPEGWQFEEIGEDALAVGQEAVADPASLGFHLDRRPFAIDAAFKARLRQDIARGRESYADFVQDSTTVAGAEAWRIRFTTAREKCTLMHVFRGNTVVHIIYRVEAAARELQQRAIDEVLAGVCFLDGPEAPPPPPQREFAFRDPECSLVLPEGWGGRRNPGSEDLDALLSAWQRDNYDGELSLSYRRIPPAQQQVSPADRLREMVDATSAERIVRKQDDLLVDGLPGWLTVGEQRGPEIQDVQRCLQALIQHGTHEFVLKYTDTAANFERNAEAITRMLHGFRVNAGERANRGTYRVGALSLTFVDIRNHRFEEAIAALASRDLLRAYQGDRFDPERPVTRAQALRTVLDARNRLMASANPSRVVPLSAPAAEASGFLDVAPGHWLGAYARYAREQHLLPLGSPDRCEPDEAVTLAAGLGLLLAAFEIPLWAGPVTPAWKPVMDKGYEFGLIPRGVDAPAHPLTNAEMAGLVEAMLSYLEP